MKEWKDSIGRILKEHKNMFCYVGLDLHNRRQFSNLEIIINSHLKDKEGILFALREGNFFCRSKFLTFGSKGDSRNYVMLFLARATYCAIHTLRSIIGLAKTSIRGKFLAKRLTKKHLS